jgi:hypothetical protein
MGRTKRGKKGYTLDEYDFLNVGIKKEAVPAQRALYSKMSDLADEGIYPRCHNNTYWYTDYDSRGFELPREQGMVRPLTADECEELCFGCPLLKLCYDFAVANDERFGIWGGINFGVDYNNLFDEEEESI